MFFITFVQFLPPSRVTAQPCVGADPDDALSIRDSQFAHHDRRVTRRRVVRRQAAEICCLLCVVQREISGYQLPAVAAIVVMWNCWLPAYSVLRIRAGEIWKAIVQLKRYLMSPAASRGAVSARSPRCGSCRSFVCGA